MMLNMSIMLCLASLEAVLRFRFVKCVTGKFTTVRSLITKF